MSGGVGVHLEVVGRIRLSGRLQDRCPESSNLLVGGRKVVDPQIEMDLLWCAVRPRGPNMVWSQLNADSRFTVHAHHVPVVLSVDGASKYARPERALRSKLGGVEDDDLMTDPHFPITIPMSSRGQEHHPPRVRSKGAALPGTRRSHPGLNQRRERRIEPRSRTAASLA